MGPRAGLDGRKISSPPGFDPGPSSPWSVVIPTELPGPHSFVNRTIKNWNQLPAEALGTFRCKPKILRKRFGRAIINGVK